MTRFSALCTLSLLVIALPALAVESQWPDSRVVEHVSRHSAAVLDGGAFQQWAVFSSSLLSKPILAYGSPVSLDRNDPAGSALQLILDAAGSRAQFDLQSSQTVGNLTRLFFRQQLDEMPVLCGRVDVTLNARGELMRWSLRDYSDWPANGRHALSASSAALPVLSHLEGSTWALARYESAWLPGTDTRVLLPVYWIWLAGDAPDQRWEAIVNASSGEILFEWSGIHTDVVSGVIRGPYWRAYIQDEPQMGIHPYEIFSVNGQPDTADALGQFSHEAGSQAQLLTMLRSPYVDVQNEDAPAAELTLTVNAPFTPFYWDWLLNDASHPELNLYYHTAFIHEYYKALDPGFTALDYPLPAVANVGSGYDNAYWNGYGTYYGSGSQYSNFAMFSDVIYHEYTHGVTDGIYPNGMLPYTGQPGALNEAWSDYIACSINGDPLMGDYMLGGNPHSAFRDLESHMVFPQNWVGEVHGDSPFISAPLWTIRAALGVAATDLLAHFARYALSETFFDYLVAVLETDDDDGDLSNGTPHAALIYGAFGDHGIGPGDDPHFVLNELILHADGQGQSIGDGDRFMEQGEIAELSFTLLNDAPLFPPPATGVQITISASDPDVSLTNASQFVATLPAGGTFDLAPVLLQFSASAADHWIVLNIDIVCNGGEVTFHRDIEFTLGTPHLLIVKDDPTSDVEHFVTGLVRNQDRIYEAIDVAASQSLPADRYLGYGMVIWLSGNADGDVLTAQDRAWLTAFVQAGNKVVLSGQDIVDNLAGSDFTQNVLQVEVTSDTVLSHAITMTAAPFEPEAWYLTTGTNGAANQRTQSSFIPIGSSSQVSYYGRLGSGPVSGVSFANGNGLLFGFGVEAISGMSGSASFADFMNHLYAWAGELLGDVHDAPLSAIPAQIGIASAYPNPFNASTTLVYNVPADVRAELTVFDVLGRVVQRTILPASAHTFQWQPQAASGLYFAQICWQGGQTEPIKLLQLR